LPDLERYGARSKLEYMGYQTDQWCTDVKTPVLGRLYNLRATTPDGGQQMGTELLLNELMLGQLRGDIDHFVWVQLDAKWEQVLSAALKLQTV
jgi:hypothetical protein